MTSSYQKQKNKENYLNSEAYKQRAAKWNSQREDAYRKKLSPFQSWLVTFCEEKQIDMSIEVLDKNGDVLQVGDVLSAMMSAPKIEQDKIKQTFVMIDFKNGDVYHFIRHCAQALNQNHKADLFNE